MIRRLQDASEQDRIDDHSNRQRKRKRYEQAREIVGTDAGGGTPVAFFLTGGPRYASLTYRRLKPNYVGDRYSMLQSPLRS